MGKKTCFFGSLAILGEFFLFNGIVGITGFICFFFFFSGVFFCFFLGFLMVFYGFSIDWEGGENLTYQHPQQVLSRGL